MSIPADRSYTRDHEWIMADGANARVGITEYAADALGDIVFVDPPASGAVLSAGKVCGEVESTKSVSDLIAPASGTVIEQNGAVVNAPETINEDPYGAGWLYTMKVSDQGETMDHAEYAAFLAEQE